MTDLQLIDRGAAEEGTRLRAAGRRDLGEIARDHPSRGAEQAAREALKAQIARLDHEICAIVANRFPHVPPPAPAGSRGPRLLDLGELERSRDRLATQLQELRAAAAARADHELAAREQLRRMKLEP
ncbi:MAG TPA: hypothetical protein VFY36_05540, partial [Solirubrobacteraceae bacterium]|nr:hypothetical protein [Solirubrobacteraceae bacterium]